MTKPAAQLYELIGALKGYRGDYEGAVQVFTAGIIQHPDDPRLYRHRAHRYMNLRKLDQARDDFEKAATLLEGFEKYYEYGQDRIIWQLEQHVLNGKTGDVFPNHDQVKEARGYYASLPFKIYYHLGVTQHILGQDQAAVASLEKAMTYSENTDLKVATANWLVVLYGYTGQKAEQAALLASIDLESDASVNKYYQDLLKLYKGDYDAAQLLAEAGNDSRGLATHGYGLASWYISQNRIDEAQKLLDKVISEGDKGAFGTVAAEHRRAAMSSQTSA